MQLQKAERKKVKIKMAISSPTGFGKTYSALLIAFGITNDWDKIAVIDTENESASLYSDLGEYHTITLKPPFNPEKFTEAIQLCETNNIEVIIIDSITHVWHGQGGLLEYQTSLGGRYQDWAKTTPRYQKWLDSILQSNAHIITTMRKKQGYSMTTENGKTKVEKAGLEDQIRDGYDYEMTIAFEIINDKHMAKVSKDRTRLFADKPEFIITTETGKQIRDWCNQGRDLVPADVQQRINDCKSVKELLSLFEAQTALDEEIVASFTKRRGEIEMTLKNNFKPQNDKSNGRTVITPVS